MDRPKIFKYLDTDDISSVDLSLYNDSTKLFLRNISQYEYIHTTVYLSDIIKSFKKLHEDNLALREEIEKIKLDLSLKNKK